MSSRRFLWLALGWVLAAACSDAPSPSSGARPEAPAAAGLPPAPGLDAHELENATLAEKYAAIDPSQDGWDTEVVGGVVAERLHTLGQRWSSGEGERYDDLVAPAFRGGPLRPLPLREHYREGPIVVLSGAAVSERPLRGPDGLAAGLAALREPYAPGAELSLKFKVVRVELEGDEVRTAALFQAHGRAAEGEVHQTSTWHARWDASNREALRLVELSVEDYIESHSATGELFEDWTVAVLGGTRAWKEQLAVNVEHWLGSIQGMLYSEFLGHQGLCVGDVNGDGLEDLYACQAGGLPNRLFVQRQDGTVRDASREAGVDFLDPSRGALLVDLEGDGDEDLIVSMAAALVLLANDGRGHFEPRWRAALPQIHSLAAADYDRDGDLDVYGCAYKVPDERGVAPLPYHDANNGEPNVLLRNDGRWRFSDVTAEVGLDENNRRYSFAASWEDYDNDGDLDLYVANDFGRNNLYRNEGGHFRDVAGEAGVEDISAGMAVTWGDYDADGWMDVHVSNMFSSAGNRIAYQRRFQERADEATLGQFRRHARGDSLFRNAGDGTFRDVSLDAGITMGRWAWCSKFGDINNDARLDLLVVNGLVTSEEPKDL